MGDTSFTEPAMTFVAMAIQLVTRFLKTVNETDIL